MLKAPNPKLQVPNKLQIPSIVNDNSKYYDLELRTLEFGKRIIRMSRALSVNPVNRVLINQIVRSGTSIGANYREANETETKKDFLFRLRIARKEAKETIYWLNLIIEANVSLELRIEPLVAEGQELLRILAAIIEKSKHKKV